MNLGGKTLAALAACCLTIALAGCGDDAPSTNASSSAADSPSAGTGSTGASGFPKEKESKRKKATKAEKFEADRPATPKSERSENPDVPDPIRVTPDDKKEVRAVFNKNINALLNGDVDLLCGTIYSAEFKKMLEPKGGCEEVTSAQVESISAYTTKIKGIAKYPNSELVAVYADFKFTNASGAHKSYGGLYFKREGGTWKRAVPPKA